MMPALATRAEMVAHANHLERAADEDDFRDRNRERLIVNALARRIAARIRQDYGGDGGS